MKCIDCCASEVLLPQISHNHKERQIIFRLHNLLYARCVRVFFSLINRMIEMTLRTSRAGVVASSSLRFSPPGPFQSSFSCLKGEMPSLHIKISVSASEERSKRHAVERSKDERPRDGRIFWYEDIRDEERVGGRFWTPKGAIIYYSSAFPFFFNYFNTLTPYVSYTNSVNSCHLFTLLVCLSVTHLRY